MYAKLMHGGKPHSAAIRPYLLHRITAPTIIAVACFSSLVFLPRAPIFAKDRPPNFIIFFTDDQGYNDVGCFGSPLIKTPRFDRMAEEGMRFTSFYAQVVCGPSRAAIMTGCYPIRIAEPGNKKTPHTIVHTDEITIAEVLKTRGYATACIGKWHIAGKGAGQGRGPFPPELMPNGQGFDHFFGTALHNGFTREVNDKYITELMLNGRVIESPTNMDLLTQRYTQEAVKFIRQHKDRPFFIYLAHNMPHVPLGASEKFRGRSKRGLYGDVVEELDWSAGEVIDTLEELGLDGDTLIVFTSDNGPWIEEHLGDYGGSADPLRGWKMSTWDGGCREPCIMRWPGKIPPGASCDEIATTMDLLPTFAKLAAAELPKDRVLDGRDIRPLMFGQPGATTPHTAFYYYAFTHLQAVRSGNWKLVRPRPARPPWTSWYGRMIDAVPQPELYDLQADIGEKHDVAAEHPEVVAELMKLIEQGRTELGDYDRVGQGARFFDEAPRRPNVDRWQNKQGRAGGAAMKKVAYDGAQPVGNLRFDFETGDLQGWRVVDGRFDLIVSDRTSFPNWPHLPFNKQGKYHLTTADRRDRLNGDDTMTGVIRSPTFVLEGPAMTFLVGGGAGQGTHVALCDTDGKELLTACGNAGPILKRVRWNVKPFVGQRLFLQIVDKATGGWGHVTFDDFSAEGKIELPVDSADSVTPDGVFLDCVGLGQEEMVYSKHGVIAVVS